MSAYKESGFAPRQERGEVAEKKDITKMTDSQIRGLLDKIIPDCPAENKDWEDTVWTIVEAAFKEDENTEIDVGVAKEENKLHITLDIIEIGKENRIIQVFLDRKS